MAERIEVPMFDKVVKRVPIMQWRPIASAPKRGVRVLATWARTWPDTPHIEVCENVGGRWRYSYDGDAPDIENQPTHWMKLPEPPE